ncbi:MAG TPA: MFS transporter [Candidatus Wallbacteria bacterium]|nr:MFS transporter [Candidatus Wallbacteria bacterium]
MALSTAFINPFVGSAINVALPAIGNEFLADAVLLSWVAMSYLLVSAVLMVPFGRLADIFGRKKIYLTGITLFTLSNAFCAFSGSIYSLIAFRTFQGISSSMIFSTSMAILMSAFPGEGRGRALGLMAASTYTGLSAGPFAGGLMTQVFGWRSIFWFSFAVSLQAALLTYYGVKSERSESHGESFDYAGAIVYSISMCLLLYGFTKLPAPAGFYIIAAGLLAGFVFLRVETVVDSPVLNVNIFKGNRQFALSNLAALIHYSATFGLTFLLSLYLQYNKGMTPRQAGTVLIAQPIMMAVFSPVIGKLSEKIEPMLLASAGIGLTGIGLFLFAPISADTSLNLIILNLLMIGFGFALFSSPNVNAVMSSVEKRYYGVASGILSTMRATGQAMSMGISSMLIALYVGKQQIGPANLDKFLACSRTAFTIFAMLCLAGMFCSLARGKVHKS